MTHPRHEQLDVWRKAAELAEKVYRKTARFPAEEKSGMTATLRRLAVGIAATLAQGYDGDDPDRLRKALTGAQASLCEMQSHLYLAGRLGMAGRWQLRPLRRGVEKLIQRIDELVTSFQSQQDVADVPPLRRAA